MTFTKPVCNCPDATNEAKKNLFSSYNSNTLDRNWKSRTSAEGVTSDFTGIRKRGYYCKHEMAVLRLRNELDAAFPDGVPYEPKIEKLGEIGIEYNQSFSSDNLQSDKLFVATISEVIDNV